MSRRGDGAKRVSLLIRNLPLDARSEEVREKFERYGEIRDIYLPKDYYTKESTFLGRTLLLCCANSRPRGFGFIEFKDNRDAEDALYHLDRSQFMGREISVVLSKESRKTPRDMIHRERVYGGGGGGGHRGGGGYDRGRDNYRDRSPRRYSRSPRGRGGHRDRSRSRDRYRSRSRGRDRSRSRDRSRTPDRDRSRSRDRSRERDRSRGRRQSVSRSPAPAAREQSRSRSPPPPLREDSPPPREDSPPPREDSPPPRNNYEEERGRSADPDDDGEHVHYDNGHRNDEEGPAYDN